MISIPTKEALMALEQARRLPRWAAIDDMLTAELQAILDRILGAKDTADLHDLRGQAKAIKTFQTTWREAGAMLAKTGQSAPL